eukprot:Sspe_Gene.39052::Locus_18848_Transcript_1_1_Confidence_1.000_Length_769::g.39052::m.39052
MSTTAAVIASSSEVIERGLWLRVADVVTSLLIFVFCFVALFEDWVTVEVWARRTLNTEQSKTLGDLRSWDGDDLETTRRAADAATAFLSLLIATSFVVALLPALHLVATKIVSRVYPFTAFPLIIIGTLVLAMSGYTLKAVEDDLEATTDELNVDRKITVSVEVAAIFAFIAGALSCLLALVKLAALCFCRGTQATAHGPAAAPYGDEMAKTHKQSAHEAHPSVN